MDAKYELILLPPAQSELEEIALVYLELAGPQSAQEITDRIYAYLEKLQSFPDQGLSAATRSLLYRDIEC